MKKAYERLMEYAAVYTPSDDSCEACPSSSCQFDLAGLLVSEMKSIGISDAYVDKHGYVYGTIPATKKADTVIGFIAHMDVVAEVPSENPKLRIVKNYDGGTILLNEEQNITMSPDEYSSLKGYIGKDLLVTDGTTILGADDKAGIAEIMTMAEYLITHPEIPHVTVKIGFTPDEEIGRGADLFDVDGFGADFAYTADGAAFGEVDFETFNAYAVIAEFTGLSIHPGSAKGKMINAMDAASEFNSLLPPAMKPRFTDGYEGFIHLCSVEGNVEKAVYDYIVRDHDMDKIQEKLKIMQSAAEHLNSLYNTEVVKLKFKEQYRNMGEVINENKHLITNAYEAIRRVGGTPVSNPVRGGTDGARLSFMGLPCPNLGTASHNHHGRFEYACCDDMEKCVLALVEIAKIYAE